MIDIEVTNDYNSNLSYDRKSIKYLFEQVFNKENILYLIGFIIILINLG